MNDFEVIHLSKRFSRHAKPVVNDISFNIKRGEILVLVGPSGCGKTTTLRMIAGLETPDHGEIRLDGKIVSSEQIYVPTEKRGVGMVFQDHALFPNMTIVENVGFGLIRTGKRQKKDIILEMLQLVNLESYGSKYPHELSGGERQRIALARALAPKPALLLLDEPFSSLDADLRIQIREQVRRILKELQITAIFVTHDQEEALYMGDRLIVLQNGKIQQMGTPEEVFHASQTRFVAEFMGSSDLLPGFVTSKGIETPLGFIPQKTSLPTETPVDIALRADDVDFVPNSEGNAVIMDRFFQGPFYLYRLRITSGQTVHAFKIHTDYFEVGTHVTAFISAQHPLSVFQSATRL